MWGSIKKNCLSLKKLPSENQKYYKKQQKWKEKNAFRIIIYSDNKILILNVYKVLKISKVSSFWQNLNSTNFKHQIKKI